MDKYGNRIYVPNWFSKPLLGIAIDAILWYKIYSLDFDFNYSIYHQIACQMM
jgi:hypothetical protein